MRIDLLSDLTTIGYAISLEGDKIRLSYRKQGNPPDMAQSLIEELGSCKAEAVEVIKTGFKETITPAEIITLE